MAVVAGTTWRSQDCARACLLVCLDAVLVSCQLVRKFIEAEGCDPLRREVGVEGCVNYEVARFGKGCVGRVSGHKRGRGALRPKGLGAAVGNGGSKRVFAGVGRTCAFGHVMEDPEQLLQCAGLVPRSCFLGHPERIWVDTRWRRRCGFLSGAAAISAMALLASASTAAADAGSGSVSVVVCPREHGLDKVPPRF